jgi:hypothetical protein
MCLYLIKAGLQNILQKCPVLIISLLGQHIKCVLTDIGGIVTYDREQNKCIFLSSPVTCCKISVLSTYSGIRKNTCYLYTEITSSHMGGLPNEDRI